MEGEPFLLCVVVTSGSNQRFEDVNVDINVIGGTATGDKWKKSFLQNEW